ncbi:MAG: cbb3-type cytochrome c oxidase subunit I [Piscinibacter sp.]|nr:cbb3-type cytochrome c oxidase subunit I [Piscinibacter sp.]
MPQDLPRPLRAGGSLAVKAYLGTSFIVLLLMMLAGVAMRTAQAGWIDLGPDFFYQVMTVHGAGMVGIAALAGAGVMWFFLHRYVDLSESIAWLNYGLFLLGVVLILGAIFIGGYAGGWTFLWPLPAHPMGQWSAHAAAAFIGGLILIGLGFLAFYFDAAVAIGRRYGGLLRGLGVDQLLSGRIDPTHPPTVVASCMVIIVNTLGTLTGAVVLIVTLVNLYYPELTISALLAKNLIYFFGHVFINATIYMSVIAVYELLPLYAKRPWKVSRPFLAAWAAATVFVMAVYPHHLLLDTVMPRGLLVLGQVVSYLSGIPVLLVTAYGALLLVYRSDIDWAAPARWLVLSMFGWSAGVIPAIVDGTIHVNKVMHNTMWVPGHFHFYLLVGLLPMLIGFSLHVFGRGRAYNEALERAVFWVYTAATVSFCIAFLLGGWASVPRRWAQHAAHWLPYDRLGSVAGVAILLAMLALATGIVRRIVTGPRPALQADEH